MVKDPRYTFGCIKSIERAGSNRAAKDRHRSDLPHHGRGADNPGH